MVPPATATRASWRTGSIEPDTAMDCIVIRREVCKLVMLDLSIRDHREHIERDCDIVETSCGTRLARGGPCVPRSKMKRGEGLRGGEMRGCKELPKSFARISVPSALVRTNAFGENCADTRIGVPEEEERNMKRRLPTPGEDSWDLIPPIVHYFLPRRLVRHPWCVPDEHVAD